MARIVGFVAALAMTFSGFAVQAETPVPSLEDIRTRVCNDPPSVALYMDIVPPYVRAKKGWAPSQYCVKFSREVDDEVFLTVFYLKDYYQVGVGGGKSFMVVINKKDRVVTGELAFQ